jgi:hypothetical protein
MTPYGDPELLGGYEDENAAEKNHLEEMGNELVVFEPVQDEAPADHVNLDGGEQFNEPGPHGDAGFDVHVCSFWILFHMPHVSCCLLNFPI